MPFHIAPARTGFCGPVPEAFLQLAMVSLRCQLSICVPPHELWY